MREDISIACNGKTLTLPNCWERLGQEDYLALVADLQAMSRGELLDDEMRINLLCRLAGWQKGRIREEDDIATLLALSQRITFPLTTDKEGRPALNLCWFAQLVPRVGTTRGTLDGYQASRAFDTLSCSLTALQYVEARELLDDKADRLPLLAAVLYCPAPYDSGRAHRLAEAFREELPPLLLTAIAWNFRALNNFLFTRTPFQLLTRFKERAASPIATDAADALYDLSADGLGNNAEIERMNVLTYLRILRKKTIDAVRQLRTMGKDVVDISTTTGLPIEVINDMI